MGDPHKAIRQHAHLRALRTVADLAWACNQRAEIRLEALRQDEPRGGCTEARKTAREVTRKGLVAAER